MGLVNSPYISLSVSDTPWNKFHGLLSCLYNIVSDMMSELPLLDIHTSIVSNTLQGMQSDKPQISELSVLLCGKLLLHEECIQLIQESDKSSVENLVKGLVHVIKPSDDPRPDVRRMAIVVLKNIAKQSHNVNPPIFARSIFVTHIFF
jgi:hypothetical protein